MSGVLAGAAAVAAIVAAAPSASADTNTTTYASCQGSIIGSEHIRNGAGTIISTVQIWEYETRGTTLCVRNVHKNGYVGKTVWTGVAIGALHDRDYYAYYAGAIRRGGGFYGNWVQHGGSDPTNPDRDVACHKVTGKTDGHTAQTMWACYSTQVSR